MDKRWGREGRSEREVDKVGERGRDKEVDKGRRGWEGGTGKRT